MNGGFCALYDGMDLSYTGDYVAGRYTARDLIERTIIVGAAEKRRGTKGWYLDTSYSNYGEKVDVVAPGTDIYSCCYQGADYKYGTSMAAPHVTATAGLVWSANNDLSMTRIKELICSSECTTEAYDYSRNTSYRMLNAGLAVQKAFELADAQGTAIGRFVDAATAEFVASGTFKIHKDNAAGALYGAVHSFVHGIFSFTAPGGRYVLEINGDGGYVTRYLTVIIVPFETVICGDVPLSRELGSGELRIVLSWGQYPEDLDSHIVGTTVSNNRFHVAYYNDYYEENGKKRVELDVDDITSYGPETITVVDMAKVKSFKYLVHNYSDRKEGSDDDGAFNLSDSGATVDVYRGTALIASFEVPVNRKGTVWEVFSMNESGQITNINKMYFTTYPEDVGA